jgi:hypothetical protein
MGSLRIAKGEPKEAIEGGPNILQADYNACYQLRLFFGEFTEDVGLFTRLKIAECRHRTLTLFASMYRQLSLSKTTTTKAFEKISLRA